VGVQERRTILLPHVSSRTSKREIVETLDITRLTSKMSNYSESEEKLKLDGKACDILALVLDLPPTLNHTYIPTRKGMRKSEEAKAWQTYSGITATQTLRKNSLESDLKGKYALSITYYLKRDRDIDGSLKLLLDSLQGIVYENDSQVVKLIVEKWKSNNPRMEVIIKNSKRK